VCANLSQSVPRNDATHTTPTSLRLTCASGGDPITSFSISNPPDHGSLGTASLNSGLVGYTSNAGYSGPDSFGYRATSTCGAASCQSAEATFDLTVLDPQQGPAGSPGSPGATGATGPTEATGPAGQDGAPGAVLTRDRLLVASFLDALSVRHGRPVVLRYVATTPAAVVLEVRKGSRRIAVISGRARAGSNAIRWNGRSGRAAAPAGSYKLLLTATAGEQVVRDRATVRLR